MFKTYIIYSSSKDKYYTGSTSVGVELRLKRHNDGWTKSTKNGIPWETKSLAIPTPSSIVNKIYQGQFNFKRFLDEQ